MFTKITLVSSIGTNMKSITGNFVQADCDKGNDNETIKMCIPVGSTCIGIIMESTADNFVRADYDKDKRLIYYNDGGTVKTYIPIGSSFIVLDKEEGTVFNAQEWRWSDGKTSESLYHLALTKDSNRDLIAKINWLKSCKQSIEVDYSAVAMRTEPIDHSRPFIDHLNQHREEFTEQYERLNLIRAFNKVINYFKSELLPGTVESNIEYDDFDVGRTGKDVVLMKKEYFESRFTKQFLI